MPTPVSPVRRHVSQRIRAVMDHTTRYAFDGPSRLARDIGVTPAAISRILTGTRSPSFSLMCAITRALEQALGRPLDPRELMTFSGEYKTDICTLCGCSGCLPDAAYTGEGTLRPEYRTVEAGQWDVIKPPVSDSLPSREEAA